MNVLKMNKKRVAIIVIILIFVLIIWGAYCYYRLPRNSSGRRIPAVYFGKEELSDDIIIYRVTDTASYPDKSDHSLYGEEYYEYKIYEKTKYDDPYLNGSLSSIRNITDHPVIWRDNDGNHEISIGDEFIIHLDEVLKDGEYIFRLANIGEGVVVFREDI